TQKRWKCRACKNQFSVKVGTIFEDSPIALSKWFPAMWLICGAKKGISSRELARAIGVTQKTAWFMNHRIRLAMTQGTFDKLGGACETWTREKHARGSQEENDSGPHWWRWQTSGIWSLERGTDGKSKVSAHVVPGQWLKPVNEIIRNTLEQASEA